MSSWLSLSEDSVARRLCRTLEAKDAFRVEICLCLARTILALCSFFAIRLLDAEPGYAWQLHGLSDAYLGYSLLAFFVLQLHGAADHTYRTTTFFIDLFFLAAISVFSGGAASSYAPLCSFVVIMSASRWGFLETSAVAAGWLLFLASQVWPFYAWPGHSAGYFRKMPGPEQSHVVGMLFVLISSVSIGFLLIRSRRSQAESALVARVLASRGTAFGPEPIIEVLLEEILPLYLPEKAVVALRKPDGEEVFLWRAVTGRQFTGGVMKIRSQFSKLETAALCCPARSWYFDSTAYKRGGVPKLLAFDSNGGRVAFLDWEDWYPCLPSDGFSSLMVSTFALDKPLQGCLILIDPQIGFGLKNAVRFLETIVSHVGPAVQADCRLRNIWSSAEDQARSHLSRELHDGTLQSLLSAEMQIEVLRKQRPPAAIEFERRLASLQTLMHEEAMNLRDLMEKTKPLNFSQKELPDFLADLVGKFRLETGISVRLELDNGNSDLPPETCHEIVRIVHEGLSNIRKHSGARNVVVSLRAGATGAVKLTITDDGKGFAFRGRFKQSQLDVAHRGPRVIKERVRLIGAELTIDSSPGNWAQLEISIPEESHVQTTQDSHFDRR
jgi:signal transduction histidine kinase